MDDQSFKNLDEWRESLRHLPEFMRDFHDQKNLFKSIHLLYSNGRNDETYIPNWIAAHVYTVDWFLWFMASCGYTLQRTRKAGIEFDEIPDFRKLMAELEKAA